MTKIAQFAKFTAKTGRGGEVVGALEVALETARTEVGTEVYAIHQGDDPDVVWMYEVYADSDAQATHSASAATALLRSTVADLLDEPLVVTRGPLHDQFGLPES
jgi:quinol monooxygenase YgiN